MGSRKKCCCCCMMVLLIMWAAACVGGGGQQVVKVKVGVVLDLNGNVGKMSKTSIQLALSDFYTQNPHYKTRLSLLFRHAGDVVGVASAANELLTVHGVEAIIGPQTSEEATYLGEFGRKNEIPIISFTATSPSLCPKHNPYFIRAAQSDSAQVEGINAIIQTYGWREIVPIYEDTEFGQGIIPYLTDALQQNGTRFVCRTLIPPGANESKISRELKKLKDLRKRIFLVHMTASVGSKVLIAAKKEGMMSEGYAWIVTDGLSSLVDPITDSEALDAMQGIVGLRPYIPDTGRLHHFQSTFNKQLPLSIALPNIFALQAYDTVWALGMAVEKVNSNGTGTAMSKTLIRDSIKNTKFQGITGYFDLVDGELKRPVFQVFNVVGEKERIIGSWTQIIKNKVDEGISKIQFKDPPIWPGCTTIQPRMNLRIGIPVKPGFMEFVKVDITHPEKSTGFCIDVFKKAIEVLQIPIDYKFVPFVNQSGKGNGTYDELLNKIAALEVDAVVGDITIIANRSESVDFTLPYSESGVSMLVSVTSDEKEHMWIFLKPFKLNLWLVSFFSFIFTGSVVWLLECRHNTDFSTGPPQQQIGLIFWFTFSTLVFAQRERILNNLSRFLLIIWVFAVLILTQSYTANLSSMLTEQRLRPCFLDVNEIREKGYSVGFQNESFVRDFLMTQFRFKETQLKSYVSADEFKDALNRGSDNGGVAAIFDEIPYIKVFLRKYPSCFQMVGPIYRTGGFGFAFPKGSPLVAHFSRAVLDVTEDHDKMASIEQQYFSTQDVLPIPESNDPALDVYRFGGLFIITAVATWSSLLIYLSQFLLTHWPDSDNDQSPLASKMVEMGKLFYNKHFHSSSLQTSQSRVHSVPEIAETTTDTDHDDSTEPPSVENERTNRAHSVQSESNATN